MIWEKFFNGPFKDKAAGDEDSKGVGGDKVKEESNIIETSDEEETSDDDEETNDEDEDEVSDEDEDDLDENAVKDAKALYKLLKNPETSKGVIKTLAERAGIAIGDKDTKTEVKKEARSLSERIAKHLKTGKEDYTFLAPMLAAAFEEILEEQKADSKKEIKELTDRQLGEEIDRAFEKLARETKGESNKLKKQINALSDEIHPGPGMSVYKYIRHLYTIASSSQGASGIKKNIADKMNRNANDVGSRLGKKGKEKEGLVKVPEGASRRSIIESVVNRFDKKD